ncbi:MAG: putative rRNA maturation factor [Parcubacteria group bacterium GW2011_GWA2_36_10]|nr:MAG: putative rRNA maturation factor [Parcubacteria group bacterium GW2011_GWA2_36_10]
MSNNNFVLYLNKRGEQANFSWLKNLEKIISKEFKLKQAISLALVSEAEIKNLNRVYRHKNKVTDVLSFNLDSTAILGEVVICLAVAKKQAKENKKSLSAELKLLTIHGILHLLAFDHELNEAEYNKQEEMQNKILTEL